MKRILLCAACVALPVVAAAGEPQTTSFNAPDGLPIRADLYVASPSAKTPMIVLFHQAGWSRGEYREIAPKLNAMGFNALAVDLRSGGEVNDVANDTARAAKLADTDASYVDARQDLVAALRHAREEYAEGTLIAWGSSYSSSLALQVAGTEEGLVDGVLAFSPGEYFAKLGKGKSYVTDAAASIRVPTFITCSKNEVRKTKPLFEAVAAEKKTFFAPTTAGNHGARALWSKFRDSTAYWEAVVSFLDTHFPRSAS